MSLAVMNDNALIGLVKGGTAGAIDELISRYDGPAFQIALNILGGDYDDANDAVQEARIACWQNLSQSEIRNFRDWYMQIVRNCCHKLRKRRARTADWMSLEEVEETVAGPLERIIENDEASYLRGAVDALPPAQARAVRMRCLEQREYADIAAALDTTEDAIRARVKRGTRNLRERLGSAAFLNA
jgi:RNA polymerase sigma-70 factor (ECF subfamily)